MSHHAERTAGTCMRFLLFILVVWAVPAPCTVGAEAVSSPIAVVSPPDKAIVESELISVVLRLGRDDVDQVQITVNRRKLPFLARPYNQHYLCKDGIQLSYGMNIINVAGFKDGRKVDEVATQVFYNSDLAQSSADAPAGFRKYSFHVDSYEKTCVPCHQLDFSKIDADSSTGEKSPCFTCHKMILANYAFVHGPAAVWSCLMCHDGKSRDPKLAVLKPDENVCVNCHENFWENKKYKHGPTAAGSCTTCHNPHASNNRKFLRLPPGDLCVACHSDVLSRPHVISGFSGNGGHPVRKLSDPFHPGREFNCESCHNPHASNSPVFLNGYDNSTDIHYFCLTCHKM
jgi:predicted CXXCH cytochrome family protein